MKDFRQSLDNIRIGKKQQDELVSSLIKSKKHLTDYKQIYWLEVI